MAALQPPAGRQVSHSPIFLRKSFADLFSDKSSTPSLSVQATPSMHKGEPAILFSQDALDKLVAPYRFALVGKFSRRRPKLEDIRTFLLKLDLREAVTVGLLDPRHVLLRFHNEADFHRCWSRGIWYVHGSPMRVFKWSPAFHVDREPSVVPMWFQLPKLPLHLFHKEALFQVVGVLGIPLLIDAATVAVSRPSVARVCVEVDLLKPRPSRI
ncbi:uncharacterized protein [Coffea arabica]|uniref:DUF4283 domain-containing protein n=1 Tax=Coffea arabica TaxID=13443 RepID=A0ABM4X516_COFAR